LVGEKRPRSLNSEETALPLEFKFVSVVERGGAGVFSLSDVGVLVWSRPHSPL